MGYTYHSEQWLPYPVEDVFAFFANPDNLTALMPSWQQARLEKSSILPPPRNAAAPALDVTAAGPGTRLTLTLRPYAFSPFRVRWEAEITEFKWNSEFRDNQLSGPFAYWDHSHRMRPVDREGLDATLVIDHVEYEMPFGALGRLAHWLFVRRQIESMFLFRQRQIGQILSRVKPKAPQPKPEPKSA